MRQRFGRACVCLPLSPMHPHPYYTPTPQSLHPHPYYIPSPQSYTLTSTTYTLTLRCTGATMRQRCGRACGSQLRSSMGPAEGGGGRAGLTLARTPYPSTHHAPNLKPKTVEPKP